jgi:protein-disulfide isomerase
LRDFFSSKLFVGTILALCFILSATLWGYPEKDKLAEIDGAVITERQVDASLGRQLSQLNLQIYNLKRQKLDQLIDAQLLTEEAKRRGLSVATLLEQEIEGKSSTVSQEDIQAFYENNKNRLNVDFGKVQDQIRDYLTEQRRTARKTEYFKALRDKVKINTYLKPPPIQRLDVLIDTAPSKGAENAPVRIVKFEDFECPFCKNVQPTISDLLRKYTGKLLLVHKDLPLQEIHPQAQLAAHAARCANDQGKFWQYHDMLYSHAPKLAPAELKLYAKEVGLETTSFDLCLASGKHKIAVQKDLAEGAKLGLTGTPVFFINGRELVGAQPIEAFTAIIDEELALAR